MQTGTPGINLIRLSFSNQSADSLIDLAKKVLDSTINNPNFPDNDELIIELENSVLETERMQLTETKTSVVLALCRNNLISSLKNLAAHIEEVSSGNMEIATSSGFILYNRIFSQEKPTVISDFLIESGNRSNGIRIHFNAKGHNNRYLLQFTENPQYDDSWKTLKVSKSNTIRLEGVFDRPGKFVRLMVINSGGKSDWSEVFPLILNPRNVA